VQRADKNVRTPASPDLVGRLFQSHPKPNLHLTAPAALTIVPSVAEPKRETCLVPGSVGKRFLVGSLSVQLLFPCWGAFAFIQGVVKSESGFDGAVTVVKEETDSDIGVVTVNVPYLGVRGQPKLGQARIFLRRDDMKGGNLCPALFSAYYEIDLARAKKWCKQGWAVATPHCDPNALESSIGDGFNLNHAIVEWVRRLPFVDRTRLHVDGQSQGGYVALGVAADFLPVEAVSADAPIINWDYNLCYLETNKVAARFPQSDYERSPLPFLCPVIPLVDKAYGAFGSNLTSDSYYDLSPLSYLERITSPVLVVWSTADLLVPLDQATRRRLSRFDRSRFPAEYVRDFDSLTHCDKARKVFEDAVPADSIHWEVLPLPKDADEFLMSMATGRQKQPARRPENIDLPWSTNHQWSFCLLNEGGPAPLASHRRYIWSISPDSFVAAHKQKPFGVALLNQAKLDYLLQRYMCQLDHPPKLADGSNATRLNYDLLEKRDVVAGLLDYAGMGEAYARNLIALYSTASRHPLGAVLDIVALEKEKGSLDHKLDAAR
jgi:hypothetical protein